MFIHLIHGALHQVANQVDVGLVVQDGSVSGNNRVSVQLDQILQGLNPFDGIAGEHIRNRIEKELDTRFSVIVNYNT
jgi:hypothetical protein